MRVFGRILVALILLGAVVVGVDRVAVYLASATVSDEVTRELAANSVSSKPSVDIKGFPFLTQVASETYDEVTIDVDTVEVDGLTLHDANLTATTVHAPFSTLTDGEGKIRAEDVTGSAVVDYASIAEATEIGGLELSAGEAGSVDVSVPADSLVNELDVTDTLADLIADDAVLVGTGSVSITDSRIELRVGQLEVQGGGQLPRGAASLLDRFARALAVDVPIPPLPYDIQVTSVTPKGTGFAITLTAADVAISP